MGEEWSESIKKSLNDSILYVSMTKTGVRKNMLDNSSAFEGWIICQKAKNKQIKSVELSWEEPTYTKEKNTEEKHYNRFLLRVYWFQKYFSWFSVSEKNKSELGNVFKNGDIVLNYPKSKEKEDASNKESEAQLERDLCKIIRESNESANHQLPVALFKNKEVNNANAFTPSGASQIDLWQIKDSTLYIYELKKKDNNPIGIISELMYYANVMNQLRIKEFNYPDDIKRAKDYRNIRMFSEKINDITRIEAVFLTNTLHSFFSDNKDKVLEILNEAMNPYGVNFSHEPISKYLP